MLNIIMRHCLKIPLYRPSQFNHDSKETFQNKNSKHFETVFNENEFIDWKF